MKQISKIFYSLICLFSLASQLVLAEPTKPISKIIAARVTKAAASLKAGKALDVIANLKPVAAELPRQGLLILAKAYRQQKNYLDETRVLEVALGMNTKDYYVQSLLGESYFSNRNYEKAAENFASSRDLKPDFIPAIEGLEKTYEAQTQIEDARSLTEDLIKKFGGLKKHRNQLCRLYSTDGLFQEGIDACKRAVSYDPKFADNHVYLGQMLIGVRIAMGLSQRELAEKLGQHESQVSRDERNEYFGITVDSGTRLNPKLTINSRISIASQARGMPTSVEIRFAFPTGHTI